MSSSLFRSTFFKLIVAVGGIYFSYIYYGLITERLFHKNYSTHSDKAKPYEKFHFGFAVSLFQNILSFILAAIVNRVYYKQYKSKMDLKSELGIASLGFTSVYLTSQSLSMVSFPVQAIMKSSKILSILLVTLVLRLNARHTTAQYLCGFIITVGIVLFNLSQDKGVKSSDQETSIWGLVFIMISLFLDGLLGVLQGETKRKYKPSAWDQMESLNKYAAVICFIVSIVTWQFFGFIDYVTRHPAVVSDLVLITLLGTTGQIFIFYTIANFSPLFLSIVTTTRKFFTVLISIIIYNHPMNMMQWISIGLVFVGVGFEMLSKPPMDAKKEEVKENGKVKTEAGKKGKKAKAAKLKEDQEQLSEKETVEGDKKND